MAMIAPVVLFALTFAVIHAGNGWFTAADFAFLGVLGATIMARWHGTQSDRSAIHSCEPAVVPVLAFGLAVWVVANILGNYLLTD